MSAAEKASILANVVSSALPKRQVLRDMGVPKSTYYRWLRRPRLDDRQGGGPTPWNRLRPPEEQAVLAVARRSPELSCRLCLRVLRLPHSAPGGSGQVTRDAAQGWQGVPPKDHRPPPDVGHQGLLLQGDLEQILTNHLSRHSPYQTAGSLDTRSLIWGMSVHTTYFPATMDSWTTPDDSRCPMRHSYEREP